MKKHLLLIELLGLVVIAAAALSLAAVLPSQSAEPQKEPRKSLREQAQRAGSVKVFSEPKNLKRYDSLKPLVKNSAAIVIGTVEAKATQLNEPAGTSIVTNYQVEVVEVLNGNVALAPTIEVREPGGRVDFADGTFAEVSMPEFWNSPEVGQTYVFFLRSGKDQKLWLNGGPQGLFKISDEKITPQGRKQDKLMQTYNGKSRAAFVNEIRDALK